MLTLAPISLRDANAFVARLHRHHKPDRGCKFVTSVVANAQVVGVAVVGRPKSRMTQTNEPLTAEITRVCTDGTANACSMLYGACRKAAFAVGYTRVITFVLPEEGGGVASRCGVRVRPRGRRRRVGPSESSSCRCGADRGEAPVGGA
jgi:hypothetical protein